MQYVCMQILNIYIGSQYSNFHVSELGAVPISSDNQGFTVYIFKYFLSLTFFTFLNDYIQLSFYIPKQNIFLCILVLSNLE